MNNHIIFGTLEKPSRVIGIDIDTINFRENETDLFNGVKTIELKFEFICFNSELESINKILLCPGWLHIDESIPPIKGHFYELSIISFDADSLVTVSITFLGGYDYFSEKQVSIYGAQKSPQRPVLKDDEKVIGKADKKVANRKRKITFN